MRIAIRPYQADDYPGLRALYERTGWFDPVTDAEERLARKIARSPRSIIVAVEGTEITGSVSLIEDDRIAFLFRLVVAPGRDDRIPDLIATGRARLREAGYSEVHVFAPENDEARQATYEANGFRRGRAYRWFHGDV